MTWQTYELDRKAQDIILQYRGTKDVLQETHKMRMTVAYGLERFWGEHLRLIDKKETKAKGEFWREVWQTFVDIMSETGIEVPNGNVNLKNNGRNEREKKDEDQRITAEIRAIAEKFWDAEKFPLDDQRIALSVLTQFCDSLVWWTQRYKPKKDKS